MPPITGAESIYFAIVIGLCVVISTWAIFDEVGG